MKRYRIGTWIFGAVTLLTSTSSAGLCRTYSGVLRVVDPEVVVLQSPNGARSFLPAAGISADHRERLSRQVGDKVSVCMSYKYLSVGGSK